jgi:hypothetical protein
MPDAPPEEPPAEGDAKKKAEEEAKKAAAAALAHKLRMASYNNEVDKVKSLLEENADPNIVDEGLNETALHYACLTYNRDVCELLVGAKGKLDIKNVRDQLAWDKAMPNGEMAGNMELVYYLKEANFKMMDPKARKPMLEAIYQPFTDAEVKELKDAGDETADGKVARLAPIQSWSSLQDPEQLQALWDAIFEKTGVKDHKFSKAGGLDTVDEVEVTFDIMSEWFMEYGIEKAPEPAEGEGGEGGEGNEAPPAEG